MSLPFRRLGRRTQYSKYWMSQAFRHACDDTGRQTVVTRRLTRGDGSTTVGAIDLVARFADRGDLPCRHHHQGPRSDGSCPAECCTSDS